MLALELVVFDLAGTTIQASDLVPMALRQALSLPGIKLSDAEIESLRGRSKREAIVELVSRHLGGGADPRLAESIYAEFQRILSGHCREQGVAPVAAAGEIIDWLRGQGVKVALSTGFDRELAELMVAQVGWGNRLDALVCNEDVVLGRPSPYLIFRAMEWTRCQSVQRVAAVGDTESDLYAAHNAGVKWSVGVLSGAHDRERLEACPHSAIIPSVKELPALFDQATSPTAD